MGHLEQFPCLVDVQQVQLFVGSHTYASRHLLDSGPAQDVFIHGVSENNFQTFFFGQITGGGVRIHQYNPFVVILQFERKSSGYLIGPQYSISAVCLAPYSQQAGQHIGRQSLYRYGDRYYQKYQGPQ